MAKKNERPMTDAEVNEHIAQMQKGVREHLDAIQQILPPGYLITFIARHNAIADAQLILSKDHDIEAVADTLLRAKAAEGKDDKQQAA